MSYNARIKLIQIEKQQKSVVQQSDTGRRYAHSFFIYSASLRDTLKHKPHHTGACVAYDDNAFQIALSTRIVFRLPQIRQSERMDIVFDLKVTNGTSRRVVYVRQIQMQAMEIYRLYYGLSIF
ncbi:unnamed protein product [Albugo candida]|uniref:Uncharacterized protein n=1 Tax=Albugo candida TaxID=65357 RepID=A0A024FVJ9_9STRA|nr:unnamed protein product [Albugo candida]|eukprot:CCI10689.1 unnamed protein product [Albugo candida]